MKKLLLMINCVLAFLLAAALWSTFKSSSAVPQVVAAKKNRNNKTAPASTTAPAAPAAVSKFKYPADAQAAAVIVNKNIFNTQRIGGAVGGRGVATYSLVGVTNVGNVQAAVILTKGNVRMPNNMPPKRYYRVGDELPNGYTLSEIKSDGVVLSRGSSTMNLVLAQASENFPAARTNRPRPNQTQQMLNLMQQQMNMQQQQQMNMMRMMRNNQNNSGTSSRGRSTNSRGR